MRPFRSDDKKIKGGHFQCYNALVAETARTKNELSRDETTLMKIGFKMIYRYE